MEIRINGKVVVTTTTFYVKKSGLLDLISCERPDDALYALVQELEKLNLQAEEVLIKKVTHQGGGYRYEVNGELLETHCGIDFELAAIRISI